MAARNYLVRPWAKAEKNMEVVKPQACMQGVPLLNGGCHVLFAFSTILWKCLDLQSWADILFAANLLDPFLSCWSGGAKMKVGRKEPAETGKDLRGLWEVRSWETMTQDSGVCGIWGSNSALCSVNFSLTIWAATDHLQFKEQEPSGGEHMLCVEASTVPMFQRLPAQGNLSHTFKTFSLTWVPWRHHFSSFLFFPFLISPSVLSVCLSL